LRGAGKTTETLSVLTLPASPAMLLPSRLYGIGIRKAEPIISDQVATVFNVVDPETPRGHQILLPNTRAVTAER
jgi:hypothetical protein